MCYFHEINKKKFESKKKNVNLLEFDSKTY